jgi:hypothetical protein
LTKNWEVIRTVETNNGNTSSKNQAAADGRRRIWSQASELFFWSAPPSGGTPREGDEMAGKAKQLGMGRKDKAQPGPGRHSIPLSLSFFKSKKLVV